MKKFLFWATIAVVWVGYVLWICTPEVKSAETEERIIDLPQDANKWFVSIVGDPSDSQYNAIASWFSKDAKLAEIRKQVHFWKITSNSKDFSERYAHNVSGLPTVRIQRHDGFVIWEGAGKEVPTTAAGLYDTIADAATNTEAIFPLLPWRRTEPYLPILPLRDRPVLPWRQKMEDKCGPDGCPAPEPPAPDMDYGPMPPDDGGAPVIENTGPPIGLVVVALVLCVLGGATGGIVSQWKKITSTE